MVRFKLYAQARDEKPYLMLGALKNGEVKNVQYYSLRTFIRFTDIGEIVWEIVSEYDNQASMKLTEYSMLEEDKSWTVHINTTEFNINLQSRRYKQLGTYPSMFYIKFDIYGKYDSMVRFIKNFIEVLGRDPWEGINWGSFTSSTHVPKSDVIQKWNEIISDEIREETEIEIRSEIEERLSIMNISKKDPNYREIFLILTNSEKRARKSEHELIATSFELNRVKDSFNKIIGLIGETLIVINPDMTIKMVNKATLDLLGYSKNELIGKPIERIIPVFSKEMDSGAHAIFEEIGLKKLIEKGFVRKKGLNYLTKEGKKLPMFFSGAIIRDKDGSLQEILFIAKSLSKRKIPKKEVEISKEKKNQESKGKLD